MITFEEWYEKRFFDDNASWHQRDLAKDAWDAATEAAKPRWIPVTEMLPDRVEGQDYSKNVFVICYGSVGIMSICYHPEGYIWGNCYGDIFGDPEEDDDYQVTHWCDIEIPELPE